MTSFKQQNLSDEVWAIPVKTLVKEHGLSDVGLRKIGIALDIPLPPRGYWQKLAAGKMIPKLPLHETSIATYVALADEVQGRKIYRS